MSSFQLLVSLLILIYLYEIARLINTVQTFALICRNTVASYITANVLWIECVPII
jgi:hypothetical protein